jgi:hypothetical protein
MERREKGWHEEGEKISRMRNPVICNIRRITLRIKSKMIQVFNVTHTTEVRHAFITFARKPEATSDA